MFQGNKFCTTKQVFYRMLHFNSAQLISQFMFFWSNNSVTQSCSKDLQVSFRSVTVAVNMGYFFIIILLHLHPATGGEGKGERVNSFYSVEGFSFCHI